jgi:hypothetical protein
MAGPGEDWKSLYNAKYTLNYPIQNVPFMLILTCLQFFFWAPLIV